MINFLIKSVIYLGLFVLVTALLWLVIIGSLPTLADVRIVWDGIWQR